jgi:Holliday junction DNA helicase RuvA
LLELQGKFVAAVAGGAAAGITASADNDVANALVALGYSEKEADWAAKQLPKDVDVSGGIRQALKLLSKA